jgi:hypothetical protein
MGTPAPAYTAAMIGEPIVNITTGPNPIISTQGAHNLFDGTMVLIQFCKGITNLNGNVYLITVLQPGQFTIPAVAIGTYAGNGTYSPIGTANHYNPALTG